ncbi:Arc family DNA-binding protein [Burkholderia vietnamiensis]|uniref:Arc family DNA-binding protein n=1 Tax=Burkholderia vietnamiensis TaxID=60552 RepID=UPI002651AC10|nr:Arc family DNA-binding protein [Burkholderia vietnamiensis]MDN7413480.1 Arc family DNA-binding protein [Burkholderia vietnamiensis]
MKTCQIPPLGVRMPQELKDQLKLRASENRRSLNSEVVRRLEASLEAEKENAQPAATGQALIQQ